MSIAVVLADDQLLVRSGFALVVDAAEDMHVAASAADGLELLAVLERVHADVVLMDVRMPRLDGIAATARLLTHHPTTRVLVLSTFDDDEALFGALDAGASGYLLKDATPVELLSAIRAVAAGDAALGPTVARRLLNHVTGAQPHRSADNVPQAFTTLTDRERDVLLGMTAGRSNAEIARVLHLSETTVKTHAGQILRKLGVRDRTQAVVLAFRHGYVDDGQA